VNEETNRIRAGTGERFPIESVAVVLTLDDLRTYEGSIHEGNLVLNGLGLPLVTVIRAGSWAH
jgi:hypothetical protein